MVCRKMQQFSCSLPRMDEMPPYPVRTLEPDDVRALARYDPQHGIASSCWLHITYIGNPDVDDAAYKSMFIFLIVLSRWKCQMLWIFSIFWHTVDARNRRLVEGHQPLFAGG